MPRYETLPLPLPHARRSQFEDEIPPPVPLHTEASTHILEATPTSSDSEHVVLETGIYYTPTPREFIGTACECLHVGDNNAIHISGKHTYCVSADFIGFTHYVMDSTVYAEKP